MKNSTHCNKKPSSSTHKGVGKSTATLPWDLLSEQVSLPAAILYQSKLESNLRWMQAFADTSGVKLAPHGKTTMTPALFRQQIAQGAWAMTLASVNQAAAATQQGITRILMANPLVGKRNMEIVADLLFHIDFYCLVDSVDNVHQLGKFFNQSSHPLQLLIEMGVKNGRCGCRTTEQAVAVSEAIAQYNCLHLVGIEVYEGVIHGEKAEQEINACLNNVVATTQQLINIDAFDSNDVILTGAGSAWYDLVAQSFYNASFDTRIIPIIRPGCYLIHDTGIYQQAQEKLIKRSQIAREIPGDLQSSLEVWAYVQSVPEPGLAIIGMGKRDVAFDAGLPQPALHFRPGNSSPEKANPHWKTIDIMDQHAYVELPLNANIQVGDIIAFSTSHPCLTFDKWRRLCVVNDNYQVIECLSTQF